MHDAKVGLFEDNEDVRDALVILLSFEEHEVVAQAASMPEARQVVASLNPGELDIALVDGNLGERFHNLDGEEIVRLLRQKLGDIAIVGISGAGSIKGANRNITKDNIDGILAFIDELP